MEQRQNRTNDIPAEAVRLYTKGLLYADRGDTERATQLFSQLIGLKMILDFAARIG